MTLTEDLRRLRTAWERRPLVRRIYGQWFDLVDAELSAVDGPVVELGSGIGAFKEARPHVMASDVEATPWSDEVIDAEDLPFADASVANLVLIDVFHHLANPARFLNEAQRVLAPHGRVVLLEPYLSPVSRIFYRLHEEPSDLGAEPFAVDERIGSAPMEANQARATLAFFRHADELERRWPQFRLVTRRRLGLLLYPLSGGLQRRQLVPLRLVPVVQLVERVLAPLAPLLAFRCFVVLERGDAVAFARDRETEGPQVVTVDADGIPNP
jgi:SAM-dependent methyltransferase